MLTHSEEFRLLSTTFTLRRQGRQGDLCVSITPDYKREVDTFYVSVGGDIAAAGYISESKIYFRKVTGDYQYHLSGDVTTDEVEAAIRYMGWCD